MFDSNSLTYNAYDQDVNTKITRKNPKLKKQKFNNGHK